MFITLCSLSWAINWTSDLRSFL